MNKDLIKKYKTEFDHWLDGGTIQACTSINGLADGYWEIVEPKWLSSSCYIINDQYVEFRKALAEGKTIHIASDSNQSYYLNGIPGYLTTSCNFTLPVDSYSIKPEEPKFKEDNWVINKSSKVLCKLLKESDYDKGYFITTKDCSHYLTQVSHNTFTHWKPNENEYVCIKHPYEDSYTVTKYSSSLENSEVMPLEFLYTLKD